MRYPDLKRVTLMKAFAASILFLMLGGTGCRCGNEKDYPIKVGQVKLIDLSRHKTGKQLDWHGEKPLGLAVYNSKTGTFLVFPLCKEKPIDELLYLTPQEVVAGSITKFDLFTSPSKHEFISASGCKIVLDFHYGQSGIGDVSIQCDRMGLVIEHQRSEFLVY